MSAPQPLSVPPESLFHAARRLQRARVGAMLYRVQQLMLARLTPVMAPAGLTLGQWELLAMAAALPQRDQITIAQHLGIDRSSITALVDALEAKGLLERSAHADRRRRILQITNAGMEALTAVLPARAAIGALVLQLLGERAEEFLAALRLLGDQPDSGAPSWRHGAEAETPARPDLVEALLEHPGFLLRRAYQTANAMYLEATKAQQAGTAHYTILILLEKNYVSDQTEIIRVTNIDKSVMMLSIKALETRGLISRSPSVLDQRRKILALTPEGRALCGQLKQAVARYERRFLAPLSPEQRQMLLHGLRGLVDALEA